MKSSARDRKTLVKGCQWGGMVVRPDTVAALIVMKTAKGDNIRDPVKAGEKAYLFTDRAFANTLRHDSVSGIVEEVKISSEALYRDSYNPENKFNNSKGAVLLLKLNDGKGNMARDESNNGNHCRIVNAEWASN